MNNNDILRRLRYALDLKDAAMIDIFKISKQVFERSVIINFLAKEDQADFLECSDEVMLAFLDGLIESKRGPSPNKPQLDGVKLTNNIVLKKIRIALELREANMLHILNLGGMLISKSELTALFRKTEHKHHKVCGDQLLRYFLTGLAKEMRKEEAL